MSGHGSVPRYTHIATTRRQWSREEKRAIVAELDAPGGSVSEVARRHGIHTSLVFRWRRDLGSPRASASAARSQPTAFVPMIVSAPMPPPPSTAPMAPSGRIELQLTSGRVVRFDASVDVDALAAIIVALERTT